MTVVKSQHELILMKDANSTETSAIYVLLRMKHSGGFLSISH